MPTESEIRQALAQVRYPGFSRDIISFGLVKAISIEGGRVTVEISVATRDPNIPRLIHEQAAEALLKVPGVTEPRLNFDIKEPPNPVAGSADRLPKSSIPGVKRVIAVGSGKGAWAKAPWPRTWPWLWPRPEHA